MPRPRASRGMIILCSLVLLFGSAQFMIMRPLLAGRKGKERSKPPAEESVEQESEPEPEIEDVVKSNSQQHRQVHFKEIEFSKLKSGDFIALQAADGRWIARPPSSHHKTATAAEKTWKLVVKDESHSFKSVIGTYLGLNRESAIVAQARGTSSEERWKIHSGSGSTIYIEGLGRDGKNKFIGTVNATDKDLSCRYTEKTSETKIKIFKVTNSNIWEDYLSDKNKHYNKEEKEQLYSSYLKEFLPIFGSPKPLNKSGDLYEEALLIFQRTLKGWQKLPKPIQPLLLMEPTDDIGIRQVTELGGGSVLSATKFEHHEEYKKQPTYRGLFSAAFSFAKSHTKSDCEMAVYSNGDILYSTSLRDTLGSALSYAGEVENSNRVLVIGTRINTDMPDDLDLDVDSQDYDAVLKKLAKTGRRYQSNAEDYFAVSRSLFDWDAMPDFIVGGVAFDNWLVAKANRGSKSNRKSVPTVVVDASDTVTAIHQNHGKGRKDSHLQGKSTYNRKLAVKEGSWSKGRVVDAKYCALNTPWKEIVVFERRRMLFK